MYCENCGTKLNPETNTCDNCNKTKEVAVTKVTADGTNNNKDTSQNNNQNIAQNTIQKDSKNQNSNKNLVIIIISVFLVIGLIISIIVGITVSVIFTGVAQSQYRNDESIIINNNVTNGNNNILQNTMNTLNLKDLSTKYDFYWSKDYTNTTSDKVTIKQGTARFALSYSTSDVHYTTKQFADKMLESYENRDDFEIVEEQSKTTINETEWIKLIYQYEVSGKEYTVLQLFCSRDYEQYSVTYIANEEDFSIYVEDVNQLVKELKFNNTKIEQGTKSAKTKLVGEWDCGNTGYLIIREDDTYIWYKDSSLNESNYYSGTYECDDKIKTIATGYTDGIYLIVTADKYILNGEEQTTTESSKFDIAMTLKEGSTDEYNAKNLASYNVFEMKKVK